MFRITVGLLTNVMLFSVEVLTLKIAWDQLMTQLLPAFNEITHMLNSMPLA